MDQQLSQILVSSFADLEEPWLAAGRRLFGHEAKPSGEIASPGKTLCLADCCD
jgi:hypothetical protein